MLKRFRRLRLSRPLAFLDLETTGTNPATDRIVELAIIRYDVDSKPASYTRRLNPEMPIPASASAIHGIHDADVADCPTFTMVQSKIQRYLEGCDLAGFNLKRFDLPLLVAEFRRVGERFRVAGRSVLDVQQIYHAHEPRDLASAAKHYLDCKHIDAHSAIADAAIAAAVLDAQVSRYRALPRDTGELHLQFMDVDLADRFRTEGGAIVFAFGKHQGRRLDDVAAEDPSYLEWMLGQDFLDDVKRIVRRALKAVREG